MQAVYLIILFQLINVFSSSICLYFAACRIRCPCLVMLGLYSAVFQGCFLRSLLRSLYVVAPRLFLLSVILFVFPIFLFIATMSLLATFLSVVFYIFFSLLISEGITGF